MKILLSTSIIKSPNLTVKVICTFLFLLLNTNSGFTQIVNLPCQTEDVAVEDLERKDFETPSGSTAIHSQGSMHNFTLPLAVDYGPCKRISNISISIDAIGVDLSNLPPDCIPTPLPYYYNIALGCPDFTPASCDTDNLLGEPNTPTFVDQNLSYTGDFDFGENLSVDIVPVMNINCTAGQTSLTSDAVVLDYEICVTVTIIDESIDTPPDLGSGQTICPSSTITLDPGAYSDYEWGPNGETTPTIDVGSGVYTVTVTDANGCTGTDDIVVSTFPVSGITFDPISPNVCDDGQVSVTVNESYASYMWSNSESTQTVSLSQGTYDVTITDSNNCTAVNSVTINNVDPPNAGIDNFTDVCNDGTIYNIDALLTAHDIGGTWTDDDASGVDINTNPMAVDFSTVTPGTYAYTYTVNGTAPCPPENATITIQVFEQNFSGVSDVVQYCADPGVIDFYSLLGNPDIGGIWTDNGSSGVDLSDPFIVNLNGVPAGTYEYDYLLNANGPCSSQTSTLTVVILEAAYAGENNFATVCEGTVLNLVDLIDGANTIGIFSDTDFSGVLSGSFVTTTGLAGQTFNYTYTVGTSGSPCGMDDAIFTVNIESSVTAGDNNTESLCIDGSIDLNDYLFNEDAGGIFVDLDVSGGLIGSILNTNEITEGTYTYQYEIGDGITCPKDSSQIILTFISRPTIEINEEEASICESQCQDITFNLTGTPPFSFPIEIYALDGTLLANDTINTPTNSYNLITCNLNDTIGFANDSLSLTTENEWILTIPSLMDDNCSFIFSNDSDTLEIMTLQNVFYSLDTTACISDTLTINGTEFFVGNDSYQDTIPGSRCDSIINIIVNFQDADTVYINPILCAGDSTMIGSLFYGPNNLTDEIITTNPNGCDSLTFINVSFYPETDSLLMVPLCAGESTNINGTLYNDSNLSGSDTLFNQSVNGCDSIVMVQIIPTTGVTIDRNDTLCMEESIVIAGQTFDFNNQSNQIILSGAGCDTTINVALNFYSVAEGNVSGTFCPDYFIEINGNIYDFNNRTGVEPILNGNQFGCDSIVNINLDFEAPIVNDYTADICGDDFIEVNGTIYDQNNLTDTEVFIGISANGCDSTVNVSLNWSPEYNETNMITRCEGDSIFLANQFQFVSGTYIDTLQSAGGCDSIISTELTFISCQVEVNIIETANVCAGESDGGFSIDIISDIQIPYTISWMGQTNGIIDQIIVDDPQNMINVTGLPSDTYVVSFIDMDGATIYQETVEILDINSALGGTWSVLTPILCFDSLGSIEFIATGGMSGYSYNWNQSGIGDNSLAENLIAGEYSLTVTDLNGCTTDTSYTLLNPEEISFTINSTDLSCDDINDGQIEITNITGGQMPYTLTINDSLVNDLFLDNLEAGLYEILIEDINGCTKSMIEEILSDGDLDLATYQSEYIITEGDSVTLTGTVTQDSLTFEWSNASTLSCNDCLSPAASPISSSSYELIITNQQGCTQLIIINVIVEEKEVIYEVANVFSPNGDNVNDLLLFDFGPEKMLALEIFDRWGNRVFQQEINEGVIAWDGFYNGNLLANGVYVYNILVTDTEGNTESKFGDVMILR